MPEKEKLYLRTGEGSISEDRAGEAAPFFSHSSDANGWRSLVGREFEAIIVLLKPAEPAKVGDTLEKAYLKELLSNKLIELACSVADGSRNEERLVQIILDKLDKGDSP